MSVRQNERPDRITVKNVLRLPYYLYHGAKYHAAGRIYIPKPSHATFRITRRCNSRCLMCSDWKLKGKENELNLDEIARIFRNPLFNSVEKFNLSGGEPVLREDIVQIAEVVMEACPQIKEMVLLTNGLSPDLVIEKIKGLQSLPGWGKLDRFAVSVSIDGYGETHEKIRRVPRAFEKITETIARLTDLRRERPFYISAVCVVQPVNIDDLANLAEFCRRQELPVTFIPVWVGDCFHVDATSRNGLLMSEEQLERLRNIVEGPLNAALNPSNLPCWREYFNIAHGGKRKLPCHLRRHFVGVDCDGTLYLCNVDSSLEYGSAMEKPPDEIWYSKEAEDVRKRAEEHICPDCTQCCDSAFTFSHEFFYYAKFLLKEKTRKLIGV